MARTFSLWDSRPVCLLALFVLLVSVPPAIAQTAATGALTGTVTDTSGAVVPNATVTLTSAEGQVRTTMTGADGGYKFVLLPPGNYRVKFEASGFNTEEVPAATIDVTETEVLNRTLAVGAQSQSVTVEANVETVQTASSALGTVVGSQAIVDLPLSTRNYTDLLSLSAGANAGVNNATVLGQGQQLTAVNGASTAQNNYQVDGMNGTLYAGFNTLAEGGGNSGEPPIPNPDAIQEFKIQTSTYDASYGRNSGANVNLVTKSGTNDFHGTAFEFFRNTVLNANDWFLKRSELAQGVPNTEGALNQNQYGGVIGGPVKKDKLFFFISYQQTNQKNGFASQGFVSGIKYAPIPNLAAGRGTCPAGVTTIAQMESQCDAATQAFVSALGASVCPVANGGPASNSNSQDRPFHNIYNTALTQRLTGVDVNCNGNNISPQAIRTLQLKLPNGQYYIPSSCAAGASCSTYTPNSLAITDPAIYNEYQGVGNFDYLINSKNTVSGRYFFLTNPFTAPFGTTSQLEGTPQSSEFGNQFAVLKLTSVLSSNLVNEVRMGYNRHTEAISNLPLRFTAAGVGSIGLSCNPSNVVVYPSLAPGACGPFAALPTTTITGLYAYGPFYQGVHNIAENTPSASDQLSWTHGKHTIRTGFEYTHVHYVWLQRSYQYGNYTFDTFADFLLGLPGCSSTSTPAALAACNASANSSQAGGAGVVPASYSNGGASTNGTAFSNIDNIGATSNRTDPTGLVHYFYTTNLNAFVQDDFKITPKLTLNFGLRWEYDQTVADQKGDGVNIWAKLINLQPIPGSGCVISGVIIGTSGGTGCSFSGYTAPSNYNVALRGPLPAGVFQTNSKFPTAGAPPWDNFAPRLGFAWQPLSSNRLAVRGGFGYFYDLIPGGQLAPPINQEPPYEENVNLSTAQNFGSSALQPFLTAPLGWGGGARYLNFTNGVGSNLNPAGNQGPITPNLVTPLTYNYNLQVQYEFIPTWVLELGYVGSQAIHQEIPDPINVSPLASASNPLNCGYDGVATHCITGNTATGGVSTTTPGAAGPADRAPYLGFAPSFHVAASTGNYKFNSFQATVRKSFSHGLLFQAAYTWSRAFISAYEGNPNASFSNNIPVIEVYEQNPAYRPQSLHLNYSWALPFGHHEGLMNKLANGWTVSGVTTIQDGTPLTISDNRLGSVFGTPTTPVVSPALYAPGATRGSQSMPGTVQQKINSFINPAAFCAPTTVSTNSCFAVTTQPAGAGNGFGYGVSGLSTILGPDQNNWDISIFKNTQVGGLREDAVLQFRTEFFNAFNHPQFNNPVNSGGQVAFNNLTTFGQINSMSVNPRFIQFALKYIF